MYKYYKRDRAWLYLRICVYYVPNEVFFIPWIVEGSRWYEMKFKTKTEGYFFIQVINVKGFCRITICMCARKHEMINTRTASAAWVCRACPVRRSNTKCNFNNITPRLCRQAGMCISSTLISIASRCRTDERNQTISSVDIFPSARVYLRET